MARIRTIKPEFFDDEDVARLTPFARLAYIGLWCQADRDGRAEDRPARLKSRIFPYDRLEMERVLAELAAGQFIERYVVDGKGFLQIRTWAKHQRPHIKEPPSTYPAPIQHCPSTDPAPSQHLPGPLENRNGSRNGVQERRMGREDSSEALARSEPPPTPPEPEGPIALRFPCVGGPQRSWALSEAQVAAWAGVFPHLDVRAECQHALAWLLAAPGRTKTARGMPRFLVAWLGRSNDRARPGGATVVPLTREQVRAQRNAAAVEAVVQSFRDEEAG
jgi:hypothetical protein